jgi:hypothetical protein
LGRLDTSQIGREDMCGDVERALELAGSGLEGVAATRNENEIELVAGENAGELEPNAARAAGDECGLTLRVIALGGHANKLAKTQDGGIPLEERVIGSPP